MPSTKKIQDYIDKEYRGTSEDYKRKKHRLAPFTLDDNLEASKNAPIIIDPATPAAVRAGLLVNDPGNIQPGQ